MPADALILTYVLAALAAVCGVALFSSHRSRSFEPTAGSDRVFRCAKCGFVYTDDPDVDRSRCSQCGQMNEAFEF